MRVGPDLNSPPWTAGVSGRGANTVLHLHFLLCLLGPLGTPVYNGSQC